MTNIRNTNLRFNLNKEKHRRAWEHLLRMGKHIFKSHSNAAIDALNDYFDRYYKHYRPELLRKAERMIDTELGEQPAAEARRSLREQLNTHKQTQEHHPDKKEHDHARGR